MAERKRIVGNPGTLPPVAEPEPPAGPPAEAERTATIVVEGGKYYFLTGTLKLRLDDASIAKLLAAAPPGTPKPPVSPRQPVSVPAELTPAIESAERYRDLLMGCRGVIAVRGGYKFVTGRITDIPCVVVAVDSKIPAAELAAVNRIPAVLPNGVPTDVTVADPFERINGRRPGAEAAPVLRQPPLLIDQIQAGATEAEFLEAVPAITYEPPKDGNLEPVSGAMTVTCHVSPDAGWRVLKPFLDATERKLHLGMYDFTAPHVYRAARSLLRDSEVEWQQVLGPNESLPGEDEADSTKAGDITEKQVVTGLRRAAGDRFQNAFAHTGAGQTFASAYHIKVAVRDDKAFWLSSGNWQSSNQPDIDFLSEDADRQLITRYNREWHVVIENATLARRFQRFLDSDFEAASAAVEAAALGAIALLPELMVRTEDFFEEERAAVDLEVFVPQKFVFTSQNPLTVQPILTPDNYIEVVLDFLRRKPARSIYFQNQSLNPVKEPTPEFAEMMRLLARYSNDPDLDMRIIFRNIGPTRKKLESLKAAGFNMNCIRTQSGCHTKGIIVDSTAILLGSHNFTNQGVQVNRDASLLIRHQGIAKYFERVFLHDWEKLARSTVREESTPAPVWAARAAAADGGREAGVAPDPASYVRLPWSAYLEE